MKYTINLILLIILILPSGCLTIYFEQPQPIGETNLESFPEAMLGSYLIEGDTLYILEKEFQYPEVYQGKFPLSQLDSMHNIHLEGNLLFNSELSYQDGIPYTVENDTLSYYLKIYISEHLSDSLLLRKEGSYLVLNEKADGLDAWNISLITIEDNGNLRVFATGDFTTEGEDMDPKSVKDGKLEDFYPITEFRKMSEYEYSVNPTRKEFQTLIDRNFFRQKLELKKMKDDN